MSALPILAPCTCTFMHHHLQQHAAPCTPHRLSCVAALPMLAPRTRTFMHLSSMLHPEHVTRFAVWLQAEVQAGSKEVHQLERSLQAQDSELKALQRQLNDKEHAVHTLSRLLATPVKVFTDIYCRSLTND